jgi:hypothetical protein
MRNTPLEQRLSCSHLDLSLPFTSISARFRSDLQIPSNWKRLILFLLAFQVVLSGHSQSWSPNGSNLYYNLGNIGIGSGTPNFLLDVNGGFTVGGPNCNLDASQSYANKLSFLQNSGRMTVGWNRQAGSGETDFIANSGAGSPGGFAFWNYTNGGTLTPLMYLNAQGYVGINTTAPLFPLDVYGGWAVMRQGVWGQSTGAQAAGYFTGPTTGPGSIIVQGGNTTWPAWWISGTQSLLQIGYNGATLQGSGALNITTAGNVLIGKTTLANSSYILDVNGNVRANQIVVNTSGADYVFDQAYHLPDLPDLERYVHREHHLPGIPSAAEMQKEGVDIGNTQTKLLAKIEELTLYTIQQDKAMDNLKEKVRSLEEQNSLLVGQNARMENLLKRIERLEHSQNSTR